VGVSVGCTIGEQLGWLLGFPEGIATGCMDGRDEGWLEGNLVGRCVLVGEALLGREVGAGEILGDEVGVPVGWALGALRGGDDGSTLGSTAVGACDGFIVGDTVGFREGKELAPGCVFGLLNTSALREGVTADWATGSTVDTSKNGTPCN
jgi:hypothetical protein